MRERPDAILEACDHVEALAAADGPTGAGVPRAAAGPRPGI